LTATQEDALQVFVNATLPRTRRHVCAFIEQEFGPVHASRSRCCIAWGSNYHKPNVIPRTLNEEQQSSRAMKSS
jgi:hypothetical protein